MGNVDGKRDIAIGVLGSGPELRPELGLGQLGRSTTGRRIGIGTGSRAGGGPGLSRKNSTSNI